MSWKRIVVVAGVIALIATPIVLAVATSPTPMERARDLSSMDALDIGGRVPRFTEWLGPEKLDGGARLEARYGPDHSFEIFVLSEDASAKEAFLSEKEELDGWEEEIQQINTFAESEYCARKGAIIRCVGYVPDQPLLLRSVGPAGDSSDDELDILLLLRTARKHSFRN